MIEYLKTPGGSDVRVDGVRGNLNDLFRAVPGAPVGKKPVFWIRSRRADIVVERTAALLGVDVDSVYTARRREGTWAELAVWAAYAAELSEPLGEWARGIASSGAHGPELVRGLNSTPAEAALRNLRAFNVEMLFRLRKRVGVSQNPMLQLEIANRLARLSRVVAKMQDRDSSKGFRHLEQVRKLCSEFGIEEV